MAKPLQAYRVTSIIAFSLLLASCILLILVGLYPHHPIHIYHQPLCYDLEPCARESKIYDNQVETRELFYDCLLYHVRNVRLTCGLYFFLDSAFLFRNKQTSTKTQKATKNPMSGACLREKGVWMWLVCVQHRLLQMDHLPA